MATQVRVISILGGTGKEGLGLAQRLSMNGYPVLIGSRDSEKARRIAAELSERLRPPVPFQGSSNLEAARRGDVILLTVPYAAHRETLEAVRSALSGKILVDVTVPLVPPRVTRVQMPPAGSAALEAREILGDGVQVASAFHTISYEQLIRAEQPECDVLVTGTTREARLITLELVAAAGLTGWDAGPLENSMVSEGLTSILIGINKQYGSSSAGIRITGVKPPK